MTISGNYRWRKTTDVNREYPLFELLDGDVTVLDVGFTDDGMFEVAFNSSIGGTIMKWAEFLQLIDEGKRLADGDR
jgi:hypothetical protein